MMPRLFTATLILGVLLSCPLYGKPKITFFSQLPAHQLAEVFTDSSLIQQLRVLDASIVLGITDFHENRTATVKLLNAWGIPVTAWLMLPRKDNFWFTAKNHPIALKRYQEFKDWTKKDSLKWERVSFMVEPDIAELKKIQEADWSVWLDMLWQISDEKPFNDAKTAYNGLAKQIEADGFRLETYIYPFMLEEENQHFHKLIGLIDIHSEREIPLVFSNYIGDNIEQPVQTFIRKHGLSAIGLGSTGGELLVSHRDVPTALNMAGLKRDMQTAHNFTNEVYIFSLEGCMRQGMMPKICNTQWEKETLVAHSINSLVQSRAGNNIFAEMLHRPYLVLLLIISIATIAIWVFIRIVKRVLA